MSTSSTTQSGPHSNRSVALKAAAAGAVVGAGLLAYGVYGRTTQSPSVHAFTPKKWKDDTEKAVKLTSRERRFIKFASAEYDGQLYMTPQDFLDSVVEQDARRK